MKVIGITSSAILSLLIGIAASAPAQQAHKGEKQDHQQQGGHEQARPEQQRGQQQQPRHEQQRGAQQRQHGQQQRQVQQSEQRQRRQQQRQVQQSEQRQRRLQQRQAQNNQQRADAQPRRTQEQQRFERNAWQQHRSQNWESDHRSWRQRGGYSGYRIPNDRYYGYFGPRHRFRIYDRPFLMVGGFPSFQYEGYWFSLVDPWPQYWADDWYYTDDVYVTYVDNGYYLFNRRHPRVGLAISISF